MASRVIAIDGPAASGKSSTARAVAERLGLAHLDSGALYRAVTLAALDTNTPLKGQALVALAKSLPVRLTLVGDQFRPEVAGVDVSRPIREDRVNAKVSAVAAIAEVREWVNAAQRAAAALHPSGVVVDGRDIGSVVFPDAAVKVYLDAAPETRAKRRVLQDGAGDVATVAAQLRQRDKDDSTRAVSPLKPAEGAVRLDTTNLTFEEQVGRIVELARKSFR